LKPRVTVVGASYAGLACAVKLIEHDIKPTIIDAKPEPTVNSTGGIASWWFRSAGLEYPRESVSADIKGLRLTSPCGDSAEWHVQEPIGAVLDPEKYLSYYIGKVKEAGCDVVRPATFISYKNGMVGYTEKGYNIHQAADYVVAADGANSGVGRFVGRPEINPKDLHFGYEETLDNPGGYEKDVVYIYVDSDVCRWGYWWVFPDEFGKRVRVGLGIPKSVGENPKSNFYDRLLKKHPEFAIRGAHRVVGGQIPTAPVPSSNVVDNILFVGDAGKFCSPLHGGGIGFGVMSGVLAAEAIAEGKSYDALWKKKLGKVLRKHFLLKKMLYSWSDSDFDKAVDALASYPVDITSADPNEHIGGFIRHLARHSPRLIPKFIRLAFG
jgi:flavin-dependent dehydrogenase